MKWIIIFILSVLAADMGGNQSAIAIHLHLQPNLNQLAIAIHLQPTGNPLAIATHWQANGNGKPNAAHNVTAHTMHIAMNWSTDVTGMQVASNFHRSYKCDVWLHLPGNCNDVCDAICDMLQVQSACNTSQWSMCICSRALSTLWIVAWSVCVYFPSQPNKTTSGLEVGVRKGQIILIFRWNSRPYNGLPLHRRGGPPSVRFFNYVN